MYKIDFNNDWTFYKKDSKQLRKINLPHDAMILEKRVPNSSGGSANANFPGGIYVYEKLFEATNDWIIKNIILVFEGVYQNSTVYINDQEVKSCAYGYIPFEIDITKWLNIGKNNQVKVIVDNSKLPNSRWYTGSGIYRPVWLYVGHKEHIAYQGVKIKTISISPAIIEIETTHTGENVSLDVLDNQKIVASTTGNNVQIEIPDAKLWSEHQPHLYQCHVKLYNNDKKLIDEAIESFGVRLLKWDNTGFYINGVNTLLRGGCVHHDSGLLGAKTYRESEERRVRIIKEAGFNAIRSSHNPASTAMIEACDKYGIYMIDETWDVWQMKKSKYDYSSHFNENYLSDIKSMIERDYNHPSVIMYSIGNEVSDPAHKRGIDLAKELSSYAKSLDQTRAVTAGLNLFLINRASKGNALYKEDGGLKQEDKQNKKVGSLMFNIIASFVGTGMNKAANSKSADLATTPVLEQLDISGYNYASGRYKIDGKLHPERIIVGSETFPQDIAKNWDMVKKYPYLIGDFMWTAWDYLGEAGMGAWSYECDASGFEKPYPWLLANSGVIDILGDIGASARYAETIWGLSKTTYMFVRPVNHPGIRVRKAVWRGTNAIPSWSWKQCEGNSAIVEIYANADYCELYLNDKKIKKAKLKNKKAIIKTKYYPGVLQVKTYDAKGNFIDQAYLESAVGESHITIEPEQTEFKTNDIIYVNINIVGNNQIIESNDDQIISLKVQGGELLAYGSANPRTEEAYHEGKFSTYYGRSQAIIKILDEKELLIKATSNKGISNTFRAMKEKSV